ncbi:hypothetical protein GCM10023077_27460 [Mycolicibacterium helvum]
MKTVGSFITRQLTEPGPSAQVMSPASALAPVAELAVDVTAAIPMA